jgi:ABC-type sugar transport system substrate-binding protein
MKLRTFRFSAFLFVLLLVVAGCGGGADDGGDAAGAAGTPDETTAAGGEAESPAGEGAAEGGAAEGGAPLSVEFESGPFELAPRIADKLESGDPLSFVLSIEGTGIPVFGAAMTAGWERGSAAVAEDHPVEGRVIGPVNTDIPAQVAEIQSLLTANQVDCLAIEAHEPGPYIDVINQAMEGGVPVFMVNADSPESKRIAFYALEEESAGFTAGEIAGQWARDNNIALEQAALMTGSVEGPWAQARMKGFIEGLQSVLPDVEFINSPTTGIESQGFESADVFASARAYLIGNPEVDLVFHTDQGVEPLGRAIQDLGVSGRTYAAGFNISPGIIELIEAGDIVVSVGQGFSNQAEAGALACGDFLLAGEYEEGHVVLEPVPVTTENVDARDWSLPENQ